MEICPHCKQEFKDIRALNIHVTVAHVAYKIAAIEARLDGMDNRLAAVEKANQGIEKGVVALADTIRKSLAGIYEQIAAEAKVSYDRDQDLFEQLKTVSRDSMDQGKEAMAVVGQVQKNQGKMLKQMEAILNNGFHDLKAIYERDKE
jgi:hypothetical protein